MRKAYCPVCGNESLGREASLLGTTEAALCSDRCAAAFETLALLRRRESNSEAVAGRRQQEWKARQPYSPVLSELLLQRWRAGDWALEPEKVRDRCSRAIADEDRSPPCQTRGVPVAFDISGRRCALGDEEAAELVRQLREHASGVCESPAIVIAAKMEQVLEGGAGGPLRLLDSEQAVLAWTIHDWLDQVGADAIPDDIVDLRYALNAEHRVEFIVGHGIYALPRAQATAIAEQLRLKAAGQLGAEGVEGAREVADEIEALLVGTREGRVELGGSRAYAVFCVLTEGIADPDIAFASDSYSLYQALRANR
jgi:hypothetical protein